EGYRGTARSCATPTGVVLLAVLYSAWDKHLSLSSFCNCCCGSLNSRSCFCTWSCAALGATTTFATFGASTRTSAGTIAATAGRSCCSLGCQFLRSYVALVDPDLHADAAEGGLGFELAVVDVRTQGVQRHTAFAVELLAGHFCPAQTTGALYADALGTCAHCRLHGLLHRAAESHTRSKLLGDALGNKLGFDLGVLDLEDVQLNLLGGELFEL